MWVAVQMGHKDWTMITKIYGKWMPDAAPDAGSNAERTFAPMESCHSGAKTALNSPKQPQNAADENAKHLILLVFIGLPGGTRTPDLLLRRQLLYPVELRADRTRIVA